MKTNIQLQRDVLDELDWEPSVDAAQIGVTAHEGIVTLTGHVKVYAEKLTAEQVAKRVHGVKAVANEIEVRPHETERPDDEEIAAAALHALKWGAHVPEDRVQVTVRDGWITLEGTVDRQFQRKAAERSVLHLKGVRHVDNEIEVGPHELLADELRSGIEAAIRRSATVNSRAVTVEADSGTVILTGDVHSHAERDEAERIAWTAHGTRRVENDITITPWGSGPAEEWGY